MIDHQSTLPTIGGIQPWGLIPHTSKSVNNMTHLLLLSGVGERLRRGGVGVRLLGGVRLRRGLGSLLCL